MNTERQSTSGVLESAPKTELDGSTLVRIFNENTARFREQLIEIPTLGRDEIVSNLVTMFRHPPPYPEFITQEPEQFFDYPTAEHIAPGDAILAMLGTEGLLPARFLDPQRSRLGPRLILREGLRRLVPDLGYHDVQESVWCTQSGMPYNKDLLTVTQELLRPERWHEAKKECLDCLRYVGSLTTHTELSEEEFQRIQKEIFDSAGFIFSFLSQTTRTIGEITPEERKKFVELYTEKIESVEYKPYPWIGDGIPDDCGIARVTVNVPELFRSVQELSAYTSNRSHKGTVTKHRGYYPILPSDRHPSVLNAPKIGSRAWERVLCNGAVYEKIFGVNNIHDFVARWEHEPRRPTFEWEQAWAKNDQLGRIEFDVDEGAAYDVNTVNRLQPSCAIPYGNPELVQKFLRQRAGLMAPVHFQDLRNPFIRKYWSSVFGVEFPADAALDGVLFPLPKAVDVPEQYGLDRSNSLKIASIIRSAI